MRGSAHDFNSPLRNSDTTEFVCHEQRRKATEEITAMSSGQNGTCAAYVDSHQAKSTSCTPQYVSLPQGYSEETMALRGAGGGR